MIIIPAILVTILKIVVAIFAFGVIIFIHELGHFIAARWMGVRVNEFALGMGPKLFSFGKKETVYSLRVFPIGGFCAMEGEDAAGSGSTEVSEVGEDGKLSSDPRAFCNKKVWRRVIIVVAGALMNLVLGFVLLVAYYGIFTQPAQKGGTAAFSSTTVAVLDSKASSYQTGLRPGDQILSIDGKRTVTDFDIASIMQSDEDGVFNMTVRRDVDGKKEKVKLEKVKFELKVDEKTNARQLIYDFKVKAIKKTALSTITQAAKMEYSVGIMVWRSLGDIVTGKYGLNELAGPVGTVDAIGDATVSTNDGRMQIDWANLLMMIVLISVNVGIFNLLPLPALDGGRLVFLAFEGIFRKPIPAKYEGMVHLIGMILLLGLMLIVTFSDITRIFRG